MRRLARWRLAALTTAALAAWLVTRETGPLRALVAVLDPEYEVGAPLGPHHRVMLHLPDAVGARAVDALADALEQRLRGVATLVHARPPTIVIATASDAEPTRAAVERLLARDEAPLEIVPVVEDAWIARALAGFLEAHPELAAWTDGSDLAEADSEAALVEALRRAEAECPACRPGPERAILTEPSTVVRDDGARFSRWRALLVSRAPPVFARDMLADAWLDFDEMNRPIVMLGFTAVGDRRFAELTRRYTGGRLAIVIDGRIVTSPVIMSPIERGPVQISLGDIDVRAAMAEGADLVARLRPGVALPAGTTLTWSEHAAASAGAIDGARALTLLAAALLALVLGLLAPRLLPLAPASSIATPTPLVPLLPTARVLGAIAVTLAGAAAAILLPAVPLPGVATDFGDAPSLITLGILPVLLAHLLVALVVWLVPRLRPLRGGGLAARRKLLPATALVALAWCTLQGLGITSYLRALAPDSFEVPGGLVVLTLAGGTFLLWAVAGLVTRFGVGNGLVVVMTASTLHALVRDAELHGTTPLALYLVAAFTLLALTSVRLPDEGPAGARRLPLAGLVPIELATTLGALVPLAGALVGWTLDPALLATTPLVVAVAALGLALAWWRGRGVPARRLVPAVLVSVAALVGLVVASDALAFPEAALTTFIGVAVAPVALADLGAELTTGLALGALARVASTSDVDEADRLAAALARAHIPAVLRGVRMRALMRIMGPWLPVEVLVPAARRADAEACLRAHAYAPLVRAFEG